jgi:hypothetical protein
LGATGIVRVQCAHGPDERSLSVHSLSLARGIVKTEDLTEGLGVQSEGLLGNLVALAAPLVLHPGHFKNNYQEQD